MQLKRIFSRRHIIPVCILILCGQRALAVPTVSVPATSASPIIDGVIEDVWGSAESTLKFTQTVPYEGSPVSEPTSVHFLQDAWAFYVAFDCRTPGREPDYRLGNRDSREGDVVTVYLDCFGDGHTAYCFSVNAANVQADWILSADGREANYAWDAVFYSSTEIDSGGFTVEIAIPWNSIRFARDCHTWGYNLRRDIPISGEETYCIPVSQNEGLRVSQFGHIDGINPTLKGLGLEIYPYSFYRTEKSYGLVSDDIQLAADANWKPNSWVKLQSAFNPDFSQIEADPFALNLSKYSLYFSEKRPFFTEEAEFFQASGGAAAQMLDLFYTRQVGKKLPDGSEVPLYSGIRLTAKKGITGVGIFGAVTGKKNYQGYLGPETEPKAGFIADRVQFDVANNTTAGLMYVGKHFEGTSNQAISIDATYCSGTLQFSNQLARSWYGAVSDGAFKSYFQYLSRRLLLTGSATIIGDDFDVSEIGYVPWAGWRSYSLSAGPVFFPKSGPFTYLHTSLGASTMRELGEKNYSHDLTMHLEMAFRNGWGMGIDYVTGKYFELDSRYDPKMTGGYIQTDVSRRIWATVSFSSAYGFNYNRWYFGRSEYFSWYTSWRPASRWSLYANGSAWVERDPGGHVTEITYRMRPGFRLSIIEGMNLSVYEEIPVTRHRGILSLRTGVSFSYNFLPKSWLLVAFNDYQWRDAEHRYHPRQRVFAAKIRHLFSW